MNGVESVVQSGFKGNVVRISLIIGSFQGRDGIGLTDGEDEILVNIYFFFDFFGFIVIFTFF